MVNKDWCNAWERTGGLREGRVPYYSTARGAMANPIQDLVGEVTALALTADDKGQFRQGVTDLLVTTGSLHLAWISVAKPETGEIIPVAASGEHLWYVDMVRADIGDGARSRGPTGMAFRTKEMQYFDDIRTDARLKPWRSSALRANIASGVAAPLLYQGEVIGVLNSYSPMTGYFTEDIREALQLIVDVVSLSWEALEQRDLVNKGRLYVDDFADLYFNAVENAPVGIGIFDPQAYLVRSNRYLQMLLPTTLEFDTPTGVSELFSNPQSVKSAVDAISLLVGSNVPGHNPLIERRLQLRGSDQTSLWVRCSFATLSYGDDRTLSVLCLIEDLSGPLGVRASLSFAQQALEIATRAVPMTVFHSNDAGRLESLTGEAFADLDRLLRTPLAVGAQPSNDLIPVSTSSSKLFRNGFLAGEVVEDHGRYLALWASGPKELSRQGQILGAAIDVTELEHSRNDALRGAALTSSLAEIAGLALAKAETSELLEKIRANLRDLFDGFTLVHLHFDDAGFLRGFGPEGLAIEARPPLDARASQLIGTLRRQRTPIAIEEVDADALWEWLGLWRGDSASAVLIPVASKLEVRECLGLWRSSTTSFSAEELSYFTALSNIASSSTQKKEAEELVIALGRTDGLTGLALQGAFLERLERYVEANEHSQFSIFTASLVGYEEITESFGHEIGEIIFGLFSDMVRGILGRYGELFLVGISDISLIPTHAATFEEVVESLTVELRQRVSEPIEIEGSLFLLDLVCSWTPISETASPRHLGPHGIAAIAETATRRALRLQQDCLGLAKIAGQDRGLWIDLARDLTSAVRNHVFELVYQPKIRISDSAVTSFEALVRWRHPKRGMVPPDLFVPLAESIGLVDFLTEDVISQALRDLERLSVFDSKLEVAINLSQDTLSDSWYLERLAESVGRELPQEVFAKVIFEITETAMVADSAKALRGLSLLSSHGARFSIDDFGTGFTSLSYLGTLPLSELKIDKTFISELESSPKVASLVEAGLNMGSALGLDTVAEGVEYLGQLEILRTLGCSHAQGYLISRPMGIDDAIEWLEVVRRHPEAIFGAQT